MDENSTKHIAFCLEPNNIVTPSPVESYDKGKGFVMYGEDNQFPDEVYDIYKQCVLLQSIVNGLTDYVSGSGFVNAEQNKTVVNKKGETLAEIVSKCTLDYILFGAIAIQVLRDVYGTISEIYYIDVRKVRLDDEEKYVFYHNSWGRYVKNIKKYNRYNDTVLYSNSVFYYKNPKSRDTYGSSIWLSALRDAQILVEISKFHLSSITNNFAPSAIVNFNNGVVTDEQADEIEARLNEKFSGSTNAARLLVAFNQSQDNAVTIERLTEDNFDQKYNALSESTKNNLYAAFRAQPQLFGTNPTLTAFNSIEYQDSFSLFKRTVANPIQNEIEKAFGKIGYVFELAEFIVEFSSTNNGEKQVENA